MIWSILVYFVAHAASSVNKLIFYPGRRSSSVQYLRQNKTQEISVPSHWRMNNLAHQIQKEKNEIKKYALLNGFPHPPFFFLSKLNLSRGSREFPTLAGSVVTVTQAVSRWGKFANARSSWWRYCAGLTGVRLWVETWAFLSLEGPSPVSVGTSSSPTSSEEKA